MARPKKDGLDKIIKVTVNNETAEILDNSVKELGRSKSDILRDMIPIVSSKDFEGMIPSTNMVILKSYSDKCWNILQTDGCIFEVENLSDRMPAFIMTYGQPMVYVKYPTFKIQIYDGKKSQIGTSQVAIDNL